ncbi:MAG: 3-deoxy-7-phosphoheptulonate synthase [Thermanaerothrix sp.]|uniref:3-deoxy-7-phosphoheptulonate synthase n=1 Tax=Thermanaerothrix sp. TaxID=2972675 RepID=UPI003C7AA9AE
MIVVMKPNASEEQIQKVAQRIESYGLKVHFSRGTEVTILGVIGDDRIINRDQLVHMEGVDKLIPVLKPYKLASREFHPENTVFEINGIQVGGERIVVIAGPCAVESREQILEAAQRVKEAGAHMLRGGAYKPRTSPYSFQGLGEEGLKFLKEASELTGLPVVTEVMDIQTLPLVAEYADILQIGARNMQNFPLLHAVGESQKPVLLKRGMSSTLEELLMSAEYILTHGNHRVILCERGIRTFENFTRNTLDINAAPALKMLSHLPVFIDPSHGTGRWELVEPVSRAAVAAGADGLIIEVHPRPDQALSDGAQSLTPERFSALMQNLAPVAQAVGRSL